MTSSTAQWHAVTPQNRPLSLAILELTPLALTLTLTLALPPNQPLLPPAPPPAPGSSKKKRRPRRTVGDSDEETAVEDDADTHSPFPGSWPQSILHGESFKDLLSHGVVVSVNGQPWNRIVAHVADPEDDYEEEHGEEEDWHEAEGEEWDHAGNHPEGEEGMEEGLAPGMTRRRPRRARFNVSARVASGEERPRKKKDSQNTTRRGEKDRAIVVVYGLTPGKEYEVELRVVGMTTEGEPQIVSNTLLVPPSPSNNTLHVNHPRSRANSLRSRSQNRSRSNSLNAPQAPDSPSGRQSPSNGPALSPAPSPPAIPTPVLNPIDAQVAQLRHSIAAAHAEKEHLHIQIKEARRASQRAEAALKIEVESVKKAIEKAGNLDLRAKQKALALQEQVKQGWAAAEAAEKEASTVENGMGELESRLEAARAELDNVNEQWNNVKHMEEEAREDDRKLRLEEEKKLAEITGKLDKLKVKKEKKEAEQVELEKRLEELDKLREEAEKKIEEDRHRRIQAYWPRWDEHSSSAGHSSSDHRSLSAHPSMSNLHQQGQYAAGPAYRPRGGAPGYQPRYPSAGSRIGAQTSPTPPNAFYASQHPVSSAANNSTPSAFRPKPAPINNPGARSTSAGVNISAMPFHPSAAFGDQHHTTSLMPPQLQHRIFLPNFRPPPQPNFHPPPSVLAEQQAQAQSRRNSPTMLSTPAFPPLPNQPQSTSSGQTGKAAGQMASGPSLASIVTRAVLSPTSGALAAQGITGSARESRPSPTTNAQSIPRPLQSPVSPSSASSRQSQSHSPTPPHPISPLGQPSHSSVGSSVGQRVSFAPPPSHSATREYPPLSPTPSGPWASLGSLQQGAMRTISPVSLAPLGPAASWAAPSPTAATGGSGGTPSRKSTE